MFDSNDSNALTSSLPTTSTATFLTSTTLTSMIADLNIVAHGMLSSSSRPSVSFLAPTFAPDLKAAQQQENQQLLARMEQSKRFLEERMKFQEEAENIALQFSIAFVTFGTIALLLNLLIFSMLIIYRHRVLKQVFYLLVMNFTIIDILKGACLILWSVRILKPENEDSPTSRLLSMKIDQYALIVLRTCNLATIFNLLMMTFNEFIFIKYPLQYHRLVNRCRVIALVILSWLLSLAFIIMGTMAKSIFGSMEVMISGNGTVSARHAGETPRPRKSGNGDHLRREGSEDRRLQFLFNFILLGFCLFCLLTIIVFYTAFFRIVRRIQKVDDQLREETRRKPSAISLGSGSTTDPACLLAYHPEQENRKVKRQLLKRNKYVIVIGMVIAVYMLYLLSYGSIQVFQFLTLTDSKKSVNAEKTTLLVRYVLQILVGMHAVLQPICYFRMKEFRFLARRIFDQLTGRRRMSSSYYGNSLVTDYQPTNGNFNNNTMQHRESLNSHLLLQNGNCRNNSDSGIDPITRTHYPSSRSNHSERADSDPEAAVNADQRLRLQQNGHTVTYAPDVLDIPHTKMSDSD